MKVRMAYAMIPYGMHVPGTIPQHAMYAPHLAMPYTGTANTGDCCKKLACLLEMIAQCGDPELCGKALELCSGFQKRCKFNNWQWYEKNVLSSSQMVIGGSVEHLMRETVHSRDIPQNPQNWTTFELDEKIIPAEFAERIKNNLKLAKNLSTLKLTNLSLKDNFASILLSEVRNLEHLTTVSIANNEIQQLHFLGSLPKTISHLDMSENYRIDKDGLRALVECLNSNNLPNLTYFDISGVSFEDYSISNLLEALTCCPHLIELKFRYCHINGYELSFWEEKCQKWHNLKSIDFSQNNLKTIKYLLRGVKFLESLYLKDCDLGRTKIKEIGEFLGARGDDEQINSWPKLKKLDLSENEGIRDDEFFGWKWKLDNIPNLEELVLCDTKITEETINMFQLASITVIT